MAIQDTINALQATVDATNTQLAGVVTLIKVENPDFTALTASIATNQSASAAVLAAAQALPANAPVTPTA